MMKCNVIVGALLLAIAATSNAAPPALPSGDSGIASRYVGDASIENDAAVLFFDGFDSYTANSQLTSSGNWNNYFQSSNILLDTSQHSSGTKSLRFRMPSTKPEVSNAIVKTINPARDTLFLRAYTNFAANYAGINSAHNGLRISANYTGPGTKPNGNNFMLVELQQVNYGEGEPGKTHVYVYHPEQNDSYGENWYPSGRTTNGNGPDGGFGPYFIARAETIPSRGKWICFELMVQLNTVGQRDGRIAVWQDGALIADWQNVRFRDSTSVKLDEIQLENGGQGSTQINDKWYDNVVIATSYIGPMSTQQPLSAPENLRILP